VASHPAAQQWLERSWSSDMLESLISARGHPYQQRQETADYRVVYSPAVAIRDKPWGNVVGSRNAGDLVPTTHRSVGLPDGVWVKTKQSYAHKDGTSAPGWMLIDGNAISLGTLLEKVERGRSGIIKRYRVAVDRCDIRERPSLAGTPVVGTRKRGEVLRTDQDLNGWVRVQADFYQTGKAEPYEGWTLIDGRREMGIGPILHLWEPANVPAAAIGFALQGGQTRRNWILVAEGAAVRERPWGRVLCTWNRGRLLRCDCEKDGWARIEADFTEDGPLSPEDVDDEPALLEGWVLMDGRDLGLPRQLQKFNGEKVPPAEEPRKSAVDLKQRRMMKTKAHEAKGEDYSLRAVLLEAKVSEEVVTALASSGVDELEELISVVSRGDHHEELRKRGVGKLGVRAKLATLVQPYWQALAIKEQGNSKYKESRFEDAANLYTKAIQLIPCGSTDLALNCYANRAACFQQMREPNLALTDVKHVLTFDPSNAKALARKHVYEQQIAGM